MEIVIIVLVSVIYFIPSIVASNRWHQNKGSIIVLNIFLGWTLIGWVVALVWATSKVESGSIPVIPYSTQNKTAEKIDEITKTANIYAKIMLDSYTKAKSDNLLESIKLLQNSLENSMLLYRDICEYFKNDISMAISILAQKTNDNGANTVIDEQIQAIINKVKTLDRNKYAKTFECYSILSEYKSFIQNVSGSLNDLNANRIRLNSEFQRALSLAILEQ